MTVEPPEHDQPAPPLPGKVLDMLEQLMIDVENARQVPLSNSVMVSQEEMLDNLARIQKELPEELRAARWMVREREAYIARTNETARGVFAGRKLQGALRSRDRGYRSVGLKRLPVPAQYASRVSVMLSRNKRSRPERDLIPSMSTRSRSRATSS